MRVRGQLARLFDEREWPRHRVVLDLLLLCLAAAAALLADPTMREVVHADLLVALFPVLTLALLHGRRSSEETLEVSPLSSASAALGAISIASMSLLALAGALSWEPSPLDLTVRVWLFSVVYVGGGRAALQWIRGEAQRVGVVSTPTLIVGAGIVGTHVARRLEANPSLGLRPVGFIDADPLPRGAPLRTSVLGGLDDLESAIASTGARRVILAFSAKPDSLLVEEIRRCRSLGVQVSLVPRMFEEISQRTRLDHLGGVPLLELDAVDPYGWQFTVKHALDRGVAALALIPLLPLMLVLAAGVRLSSPGPILFRQRRVGRDGCEFDLLKFRSMRIEDPTGDFKPPAGSAPGGVEGVDRTTWFGRLLRTSSLDELPQLLNVLRGEMSIIGPRPERPEYVELFARDVDRYVDRHRVKAGITGWAQVNGLRGQTSIADRVEWDNHYIANWSLGFDLKIALLTVAEVLRFRDSQTARKRARQHA